MRIGVEIKGLAALQARISGLGKQIPFAASKALNATGKAVADAMPAEIEKAIDRPTPFTKKGVAVLSYANKARLETVVGFRRIQAEYMRLQIEGGSSRPPGGRLKLPAAIKLNEFGNIPKGVIAQLVKVARKEQGLKKATSRRVKISAKVDLFYGDPKDQAGKVWPRGIYKAVNGALVPLILFPQTTANYKPRFDFHGKAKAIVEREWPKQFEAALAESTRTAR